MDCTRACGLLRVSVLHAPPNHRRAQIRNCRLLRGRIVGPTPHCHPRRVPWHTNTQRIISCESQDLPLHLSGCKLCCSLQLRWPPFTLPSGRSGTQIWDLTFKCNSIHYDVFTLQAFSIFWTLGSTLFYIPLTGMLLGPFHCHGNNTWAGYACYSGQHSGILIVGAGAAAVLTVLAVCCKKHN